MFEIGLFSDQSDKSFYQIKWYIEFLAFKLKKHATS